MSMAGSSQGNGSSECCKCNVVNQTTVEFKRRNEHETLTGDFVLMNGVGMNMCINHENHKNECIVNSNVSYCNVSYNDKMSMNVATGTSSNVPLATPSILPNTPTLGPTTMTNTSQPSATTSNDRTQRYPAPMHASVQSRASAQPADSSTSTALPQSSSIPSNVSPHSCAHDDDPTIGGSLKPTPSAEGLSHHVSSTSPTSGMSHSQQSPTAAARPANDIVTSAMEQSSTSATIASNDHIDSSPTDPINLEEMNPMIAENDLSSGPDPSSDAYAWLWMNEVNQYVPREIL